jgi:hypothetical protein
MKVVPNLLINTPFMSGCSTSCIKIGVVGSGKNTVMKMPDVLRKRTTSDKGIAEL